MNQAEGLPKPEEFKEELLNDEDIVKKLHTALLEIEVLEGELICPETGRSFPIQNGIPNMLANEVILCFFFLYRILSKII